MKANPIANVLTGVLILLFTSLGLAEETREQCIASKFIELKKTNCANKTDEALRACRSNANDEAKEDSHCLGIPSSDEKKDVAKKCEDAKTKYYEKQTKEEEACAAFTQKLSNNGKTPSCSQKLANCRDQVRGVFDNENNPSNGASYLMQMAQQFAVNKLAGTNGAAASTEVSTPSCIKEFDPKSVRDAAKELAREKKDLEKEIKKEQEAKIKLEKEASEKRVKIKKEEAEIEAANKKELLEKEKRMSDETSKIAKNGVEISKRVRMYTTAISKKSQELAKNNFDFQTALLEFTDEKVTMQCKQQFEALKTAIIQAKGKIPTGTTAMTPEEKKQVESISAAVGSGTGIRATQNATIFLNAAKKACFEKANTTKQQNMLKNSQAVTNINGDMEELKKNIADENNQIVTDQKQIKTLQEQNDKAKSQEETEKLEKLSNLNLELTGFIQSNEKEIDLAQKNADKLTADIRALVLKTNFDAQPAMSDAGTAISSYKNARADANTACCPKGASPETDFCKQIRTESTQEPFNIKKGEKPESLYPSGKEQNAN